MQFVGKLTEADVADVRKLRRTKWHLAWVILENKYAIVFSVLILAGLISGLTGTSAPNWPLTVAFLSVVTSVAALAWFKKRQALTKFNERLPDQILLTPDGVKLEAINGSNPTFPWKSFRGWREGDRTVLLQGRKARQGIILPVAQLSEDQRQELRQLLKLHIPAAIE